MKRTCSVLSFLVLVPLATATLTGPGARAETPPSGSEPIEPLPPAPPPAAPAVPTDVAEAPATAKKTSSGLASKVLVKAKGGAGAHPGPHDRGCDKGR